MAKHLPRASNGIPGISRTVLSTREMVVHGFSRRWNRHCAHDRDLTVGAAVNQISAPV